MTILEPLDIVEDQSRSILCDNFRADDYDASVIALHPIFAKCTRHQISRLLSRSMVLWVERDAHIFSAGDTASYLYYLLEGSVALEIDGQEVDLLCDTFCGEECVARAEAYVSDAVARSHVVVLRLPRDSVMNLSDQVPSVGIRLLDNLLGHHTQARFQGLASQVITRKKTNKNSPGWGTVLGWMLVIVLSVTCYTVLPFYGVAREASNYMSVFAASIVMWAFRLLPEFVPALLVVVAATVLEVVPTTTVLSGFSSGSFFMALSVFGIGALLVRSGLTYRLTLHLLARCPRHQRVYEGLIFLIGSFLTPILPTANGRVTLISPLLQDFSDNLGYKPGGRAMTRLAAAAFSGLSIFSACILTSKSINFAVFDLFPTQVQSQYGFAYWIVASLVAMAVLAIGHMLISSLLFNNDEKPRVDRDKIRSQIDVLGRLTSGEILAAGAVGLFVLGVMTASFSKISPPWVGMTVLVVLGLGGLLTKTEIKKDIDWAFLLMLAGMISIAKTFSALGINHAIAEQLSWMETYMNESVPLFVVVFAAVVALVRVVMPNNATIILLCIAFFPVAEKLGFNPWVLGFIVLIVSDAWAMSYQCTYYLVFRSRCLEQEMCLYSERGFLCYNMLMNGVRVIAVLASIPYWRAIGVM